MKCPLDEPIDIYRFRLPRQWYCARWAACYLADIAESPGIRSLGGKGPVATVMDCVAPGDSLSG